MSQVNSLFFFYYYFVCFGGDRWGWNLNNLKLTVNNITHPPTPPQKKKEREKKQKHESHNFT